MLYDLYYHNDFDGRAAAAVMLAFLRSRGDDVQHFTPLGYDMQNIYLKENFFQSHALFRGKRNPAIVLDFAFHPKATWWFDHHPTAFKRESWRKKFKPTKQWHYDPKYESCCAQVTTVLRKEFGWKLPIHMKELVHWGDIMDGARYASPREVMDLTSIGTQVDAFIDRYATNASRTGKKFVEILAAASLRTIARRPEVRRAVVDVLKKRKHALDYHRKHMVVANGVGFIDLTRRNFEKIRYAGYYLVPKLRYMVRTLRRGSFYYISVGQNPWKREENHIDIGVLMKRYGGGGHFGVGAAEMKTRQKIEKAAEEIVKYLAHH